MFGKTLNSLRLLLKLNAIDTHQIDKIDKVMETPSYSAAIIFRSFYESLDTQKTFI